MFIVQVRLTIKGGLQSSKYGVKLFTDLGNGGSLNGGGAGCSPVSTSLNPLLNLIKRWINV